MATYLIEVSYTPAALAALIANPGDRTKVVGSAIEKLGGKMNGFWFAFGDSDVVGLLEMPDNVSMAALAVALGGGGACSKVKTTVLLSITDGIEALKKAGTCGYRPVGG